jgi:hypothetical protein
MLRRERLDWRTGLEIQGLSVLIFAAFGFAPILTWIIAPAPWELLAFGIAVTVLCAGAWAVGTAAMRNDSLKEDP